MLLTFRAMMTIFKDIFLEEVVLFCRANLSLSLTSAVMNIGVWRNVIVSFQIYGYEQHIAGMLSRPTSGMSSMEKRPFTSWLPVAEVAPLPQRSSSVMGPKPSSYGKPPGGGVWPPPVSFPSRQVTSPDLGKSNIYFHLIRLYPCLV